MESQTTAHILMIRPASFGFNAETAVNNTFQSQDAEGNAIATSQAAIAEFDRMVESLRNRGVQVTVIEDSPAPAKPDAVFPNNWISFHADGTVVTYPMYAETRRTERREDVIEELGRRYQVSHRISLEGEEAAGHFLEGTGSMILDRPNRIVYACLSPRTDADLLESWAEKMGYTAVLFHAVDAQGVPVYHTNVIMALGAEFVVICLDSVQDEFERQALIETLEDTGKEIIDISFEQVKAYAGNMLAVNNLQGENLLVMSEQAFRSLNAGQIEQLEQYASLVHSPIDTIERIGGGSARCMMAEIFLPIR